MTLDEMIDDEHKQTELWGGSGVTAAAEKRRSAARRLEECRALLQRLANDEPAPEGHTFQSWARELLA